MKNLNKAVAVLKRGGIIICPTDTVYGFLAAASNKKAVEKIYKIKKRPKPLSVFVKNLTTAKKLAFVNEKAQKLLLNPKVTVVLKRKSGIKLYGMAKNNTVAIRIPNYRFLNDLLKKINRPLVQTSANLSGQEPLKTGEQIMATFGKSKLVGLIVTSSKPLGGKSSKVIDLAGKNVKIIRK